MASPWSGTHTKYPNEIIDPITKRELTLQTMMDFPVLYANRPIGKDARVPQSKTRDPDSPESWSVYPCAHMI